MAIKDVKEYYDLVSNDYLELTSELRDMEKEFEERIISPEAVEQLKNIIAKVKDNYERISYIMFLLNKPAKKEKFKTYKKQNHKILEQCNGKDLEFVHNENKEIIDNLTI